MSCGVGCGGLAGFDEAVWRLEGAAMMWLMWFFVILAAIVGLLIFWLVAQVLIWEGQQESDYQKLESDISMRQYERTQQKIAVVKQIRATPESQRDSLWELFHALDVKDQALMLQERDQLVAARGNTITVLEQYELDNGINPYKRGG